jgi:hypothetical protein
MGWKAGKAYPTTEKAVAMAVAEVAGLGLRGVRRRHGSDFTTNPGGVELEDGRAAGGAVWPRTGLGADLEAEVG